MINKLDYLNLQEQFLNAKPYDHVVIDNFFDEETALAISHEFPDYNSDVWHIYNNPLEKKRACNSWNFFPRNAYSTFCYLNSQQFISKLKKITGIKKLYPDVGLHGGGMHLHGQGDKLNMHLDYSIHPKLKLQRKLNLIIYLGEGWDPSWGGQLHLQSKTNTTKIDTLFNRAIIFDTTQNSYHGLPDPIQCPEDKYRKSIAVYYLTDPPKNCATHSKAIYLPTKEQENDPVVKELIRKRSSIITAEEVYKYRKK